MAKMSPTKKVVIHSFREKKQIQSRFSLTEKIRDLLRSLELSFGLSPRPNQTRYFAILGPGHCGSVWLTKLLNSHPEVFCFHEGVNQRIFPLNLWEAKDEDRLAWLYSIRSLHLYPKIFRAIGDMGSMRPRLVTLPEIQQRFAIFGLTRHGVLHVRSHSKSLSRFVSVPKPLNDRISFGCKDTLAHFPSLNKVDISNSKIKNFIYCCWVWVYYIKTPTLKTYRIEDFNDVNLAAKMFKEITGVGDAPIKIIKTLVNQRINPHHQFKTKEYDPKKIYFKDWNKTQRFIFDTICGEKMKEWYEWPLL